MTSIAPRRISLWLKIPYTVFMAIQIPVYLHHYGPSIFLYFCDVALLLTLVAVWTESPVLCSAALVGIFLPQMLWINDFLFALSGAPVSELTAYMFDDSRPSILRFLSLFHIWQPFFLVWIVRLVGFDKRGILVWTALTWILLLVCFLFVPPPGIHGNQCELVNINFVYGFSLTEEQTYLERHVYLGLLMLAWPMGLCVPSHLLFWLVMSGRSNLTELQCKNDFDGVQELKLNSIPTF
jgi:hypothetical protein